MGEETKVLTMELLFLNSENAVRLPLPSNPEEELISAVIDTLRERFDDAATVEQLAINRSCGAEGMEDVRKASEYINAVAQRLTAAHEAAENLKQRGAAANAPEDPPKVAKSGGATPVGRAAYWYTRRGGAEALTAGERLVAEADFQRWQQTRPEAARTYGFEGYVNFRQRINAEAAQRRRINPSM